MIKIKPFNNFTFEKVKYNKSAIKLTVFSLNFGNKHLDRLSCYYTNASSLRCKINELQLQASTSKPHIMAISETWFANVYRRDRASHAGGVCIYVHCDLDSCEVSDGVLTDSAVEQVWCAIKICNERILIGCMYIPNPNAENIAMFNSLTRIDR